MKFNPRDYSLLKADCFEDQICSYTLRSDKGETMKVECGEVYDRYTVISTPGGSLQAEEAANVTPPPAPFMLYPSEQRFLLVSGFFFQAQDCRYSMAVQEELSRREFPFHTMDFVKEEFISKLSSGDFSCCVLFGVGSDGGGSFKLFYLEEVRIVLTAWVQRGGRLIMQGEGCLLKIFKDWFDQPWYFQSYFRETHNKNTQECFVPSKVRDGLPDEYNVKATLIANVPLKDRLYSCSEDELCAVAASGYHLGRAVYIGDVNWEPPTINIIVTLGCTAFNDDDEKWMRRRSLAYVIASIQQIEAKELRPEETQRAVTKVYRQTELCSIILSFLG